MKDERLGKKRFNISVRNIIPFAAFFIILGIFMVLAFDRFFTYKNFVTVIQQTAVLTVVSMGVHFVIVTGAIDLSVGSVIAFSGIVGASFAQKYGMAGFLIGIPVGSVVGLITGLIYTYMKIPSFIITLGVQMALRGLVVLYSQSNPIPLERELMSLGKYPNIFIVMIVVFVVMFIIYNYTTFGRYCIAVGGNEHIAKLNGISTDRIRTLIFVVSGTLAGLGGVLMSSRLGAATPTVGTNFEVSCICAVALGGTPLSGGVGSIQNTLIGALITSMLANGLTILGASSEMQQIITGLIVIFACYLSLDKKKVGIVK